MIIWYQKSIMGRKDHSRIEHVSPDRSMSLEKEKIVVIIPSNGRMKGEKVEPIS